MFWRLVLGIVFNLAASLFVKPPPGPKASNLSDFSIPRADEGARIFDFAGTVWRKDPHVAWYGDFSSQPIRERQKKK
jgi:hypothetical protein